MTHESEGNPNVDITLELDDELCNLFAAFDEVSASDELKDATLARILGRAGDAGEGEGDDGPNADSNADSGTGCNAGPNAGSSTAPGTASGAAQAAPVAQAKGEVRAVAGGKTGKTGKAARRAKWRAIRVAAIAACLVLALSGGIAYATPATYYEIEQDGTTITLGVNCFGITVDATSDSETGADIINSAALRNIPYEQALTHAIEAMGERNPDKPVEYGPRGGERETVAARAGGQDGAASQPDAGASNGQPQPQDGTGPEGGQAQPQTEPQSQPQSQPQPQSPEAESAGAAENQPASRPQGEGQAQGGDPSQTGGNHPDRP